MCLLILYDIKKLIELYRRSAIDYTPWLTLVWDKNQNALITNVPQNIFRGVKSYGKQFFAKISLTVTFMEKVAVTEILT